MGHTSGGFCWFTNFNFIILSLNFIGVTQAHCCWVKHFFLLSDPDYRTKPFNPVAMIVETWLPFCYDTEL